MLCEETSADPADVISDYMNLIMTCMFYSSLIPHSIIVALVGSVIQYWSLKYQLLRRDKMPEMFSAFLATFFANCLPYIVFIQTVGMLVFMSLVQEDDEEITDPKYAGVVAIVFALVCLCCPFRLMLNR